MYSVTHKFVVTNLFDIIDQFTVIRAVPIRNSNLNVI